MRINYSLTKENLDTTIALVPFMLDEENLRDLEVFLLKNFPNLNIDVSAENITVKMPHYTCVFDTDDVSSVCTGVIAKTILSPSDKSFSECLAKLNAYSRAKLTPAITLNCGDYVLVNGEILCVQACEISDRSISEFFEQEGCASLLSVYNLDEESVIEALDDAEVDYTLLFGCATGSEFLDLFDKIVGADIDTDLSDLEEAQNEFMVMYDEGVDVEMYISFNSADEDSNIWTPIDNLVVRVHENSFKV